MAQSRSPVLAGLFAALPVIGAGLGIVADLIAIASLSTSGEIGQVAAIAMVVLAWPRNLLVFATVIAVAAALVGAIGRRSLGPASGGEPWSAPEKSAGIGISCSGGGIRAASFGLGVLSSLERHDPSGRPLAAQELDGTCGIVDQSDYLASVSGGGFTAGAWRLTRGTAPGSMDRDLWPTGIVGAPADYPIEPPEDYESRTAGGSPTLYRHFRSRQRYLDTGRGGLPAAALVASGFAFIHLTLLAATVFIIAWPVGRIAVDDDISNAERIGSFNFGGIGPFTLTVLIFPPLAMVVLAAGLFLTRMFLLPTTTRRRVTVAATAALGVGVAEASVLLLVPLLKNWDPGWGLLAVIGLIAAAGAAAMVLPFVRAVLGHRVLAFGGLLVAAAALLFGIKVALDSAKESPEFGNGDLFALDFEFVPGGPWVGYAVVATLYVLAFRWLNPRWWSLHTLYRNRLRTAFATSRHEDDGSNALRTRTLVAESTSSEEPPLTEQPTDRLWPYHQSAEPTLDRFSTASGPRHLVCCSVARRSRTITGVSALSLVFSADQVAWYEPYWQEGHLAVRTHEVSTRDYMRSLGRSRQAVGTSTAAVAISGAAVAASMGRMNLGGVNSLLTALNLRLGVWMPNPRYVATTPGRFPVPCISNLLKEILGIYDLDDHHLFLTDGGHRENLGLVELLRRRCETIICIDASDDAVGSYATLRLAAELARTEVGAVVDLDSLPDAKVGEPMPSHVVLPVQYHDAQDQTTQANIVYIPIGMSNALSWELQAYAAEDPRFPRYGTADQLLTHGQFQRLVQLGDC